MPGYHPLFIRRCSIFFRLLFCALFSALSCATALPQGSCAPTPHNIWGMNGFAGPNWLPPGSWAPWQQTMANQMAQNGGIPSCTYTEYIDNPATGAGHWYGNCQAYAYTCTGGASVRVLGWALNLGSEVGASLVKHGRALQSVESNS
jgi:hypothetical protein